MPIKYQLPFKDYHNNACLVTISHNAYTGQPISIRGVGKQAVILDRDCGDDPYEPIVNTKATINVMQEDTLLVDVFELQTAKDREFSVTFTINGDVKFKGWLNPDGLQQPFAGAPFPLQLTATDGLMLLQDIPYIHNNLPGGQCIINYIRQILLATPNLASDLPIRWFNKLENNAYQGDDVMTSVLWSTRGEGYNDYNGTRKDCMYILEGMLRSMQLRIVQDSGYWTIFRINDMISDAGTLIGFKNISDLDAFNILDSDFDVPLKPIGDQRDLYTMIEGDGTLMVRPGLKRVITKYEQNQRDNILPNGNMDLWFAGFPLYWNIIGDSVIIEETGSLSEQKGSSITVTNNSISGNATMELTLGALPIDTDILYTYINFGFKFCILQGAVVDTNGIIQWGGTDGKLVMDMYYTAGDGVVYWLNEFGFWTPNAVTIKLEIPNLKMGDVAQIDFNAHQDIIIPAPVAEIGATNYPSINVRFYIQSNVKIQFDDIYINTDSNNDVYEVVHENGDTNTAKEDYALTISSSHNGFYLSNYMTNYAESGVEKLYIDGSDLGTLTELHSRAVLRNRYAPSLIFEGSIYGGQYSYAEIYALRGLDGKKFLPLASSWNTETNTIRLTCIESRNDDVPISVSHYGSNDKTKLSN